MNALYQMARPSDADLRATKQLSAEAKQMYLEAKQDASYWLGLSQFEQRSYGSARDWLDTRTLAACPVVFGLPAPSTIWLAPRRLTAELPRQSVNTAPTAISPTVTATCSAVCGWKR